MTPSSEFLSAPVWLVTTLHVLTLTLHFAAMGLVLGGVGMLLLLRRSARWEDAAVRRFVKTLPTAMAATVTLGVAPLLFVQLVYHRQVYAAAIVSAWYWLGILAAAIAAYFVLYRLAMAPELAPGRAVIWLGGAFAALLYVSLTYVGVFSLAEAPETLRATYAADPSGRSFHPDVGSWIFRWAHMVTGAFALGAFWLYLFVRRDERLAGTARRALVIATTVAFLAGFAYLGAIGPLAGPLAASWSGVWLGGAILLSLGALHLVFRGRNVAAGAMLFLSLLGMVVTRHDLRALRLEGIVDPAAMPFQPQWGVLTLFLVAFVVALGALGLLIRLSWRPAEAPVVAPAP